jgi:hypothetical protein
LEFQEDFMTKTIVLGDESDSYLRSILGKVMRDMGAKTIEEKWGVGGSVELETVKLELRGKIIVLESETNTGLSIAGDEHDVDEIAKRVAEILKLFPTTADHRWHAASAKGH